ncbi:MAG TPA: YIP1 family protein [Dehalococcoidia bacterium]|jgi:hypothetical protein|nr:YIP1 family protein [Dehalococcoidia bacterium]
MMSQAGGMDMNALAQRMRRLAMLDTSVFDEVRTDTASTIPAIIVAIGATLLFGIGGWLWWIFADIPDAGEIFVKSLIIGSIISVVLWAVWLAIVYVILTQLFRARADVNELIRVMGFAAAPLALGVLMFIPGLDYGIGLTATAMFFGANVIAVQTATDAPAGRVLAANAVGFLVWSIVLGLLVSDSNVYAPGVFVFDAGKEVLKSLADFSNSFGF